MMAKKNLYLKPRFLKDEPGAQRKEILLSGEVIKRLQKKADAKNYNLKQYMEICMIQISADKNFTLNL